MQKTNKLDLDDLRQRIHNLSKGDVHSHLHLSASPSLLKEKYPDLNISTPKSYAGFDGMMSFIEQNVNPFMTSSEIVMDLMEIGIQSCLSDNVTYLEASIDTNLYKHFDHSVEEFIKAVNLLKKKYKTQIDFRPEVGINKHSSHDSIYEIAFQCIDSRVFNGIDIYGSESEKDLHPFQEVYTYAKSEGLKTKVHIGEFSGAQSIKNAIELLEPDEIQHGIRAVDSTITMQIIADREIRMNICPQSNIALGAAANIHSHPIRKLYDSGIKITINTDDLLLFNASLTDQYLDLIEQAVFSFEELDGIRANSL